MLEVIEFVPRHRLAFTENIEDFIEFCKTKLIDQDPEFDWKNDYWKTSKVTFRNIEGRSRKTQGDPFYSMHTSFIDFAKAYHRYKQYTAPNKSNSEMRALKCLERALTEMSSDASPVNIDHAALDRSAAIARAHYTGAAYATGREIQALAQFMCQHSMCPPRLGDWKNPIARPSDTVRTGKKAAEARANKLPGEEALDIIADIFASDPSDPRDIFVTSVTLLLMCAPSRISEVLELNAQCEVEEMRRSGEMAYGWRFEPKKGGHPMIKWVPACMVDLAKLAIDRLRQLSEDSRALAAAYEDDPNALSLPNYQNDSHRSGLLSRNDVKAFLGYGGGEIAFFANKRGRQSFEKSELVAFRNSKLPKHFPFFNESKSVRWRDALFCYQKNIFASQKATSPFQHWRPSNNTFNDLIAKDTGGEIDTSFFGRHANNRAREAKLKITSHQIRHLISTIAERGGLGQHEIARWAGRADVKQNVVYNHISEDEFVVMLRNQDPRLKTDASLKELAVEVSQKVPVTVSEFNKLTIPTAHITEVGFCIHDFVMSPCQRFRDCLNCSEHVCIKGDRRNAMLPQLLELSENQLLAARSEETEGTFGADRWVQAQQLTVERLRQLNDIMENDSTPEGSIVRLAAPHEFSALKRAMKATLGYEPSLEA